MQGLATAGNSPPLSLNVWGRVVTGTWRELKLGQTDVLRNAMAPEEEERSPC